MKEHASWPVTFDPPTLEGPFQRDIVINHVCKITVIEFA